MGDPYVHGNRWFSNFYYEGRRVRKAFAPGHVPKREAIRLQNALETDLNRGKREFLRKQRANFQAAAEEFIRVVVETDYKPGRNRATAKNRIQALVRRFGKRHLEDFTPWFFERFKADRTKEDVLPGTVNRDIQMTRAILNRAADWGWITASPAARVKLLKGEGPRSRVLSPDEQVRLFNALADEPPDYHDIYLFSFHGALRPGASEVLGLRWEEIDPAGFTGFFRITRQRAKNRRARLIPITHEMRQILDRRSHHKGYVFSPNSGVSPYSIQTVYHGFARARTKAGLDGTNLQPKDLRRTMATRLDEADVPLTRIQALLGHTRVGMTEWYLSRKADGLESLRDALDKAVNADTGEGHITISK